LWVKFSLQGEVVDQSANKRGIVSLVIQKNTPEVKLFEDYLLRFWDYEKSPYAAKI
jgi:hypothetical protein